MTKFQIDVHGVSCLCTVTYFSAGCPMRVTGTGFGDADPPEADEIEFYLQDGDNRMRDDLIDDAVEAKVLEKFKRITNRK